MGRRLVSGWYNGWIRNNGGIMRIIVSLFTEQVYQKTMEALDHVAISIHRRPIVDERSSVVNYEKIILSDK